MDDRNDISETPTCLPWIPNIHLMKSNKYDLDSSTWLNDCLINAAQLILRRESPKCQRTTRHIIDCSSKFQFLVGTSFIVKILINKFNHHWIVAGNTDCDMGCVNVYSSLHMAPSSQWIEMLCKFTGIMAPILRLNPVIIAK